MPDSALPSVIAVLPAAEGVVRLKDLLAAESGTAPDPSNSADALAVALSDAAVREIGGRRKGLDPTRYGDWEKDGRCVDF